MYKTITATDIRRKAGLIIPPPGKRCYVHIDDTGRVEMTYNSMRTKPGGIVWLFICPVTGRRCRKLNLINGKYVHTSAIKGYYRKNKPIWFTGTLLDKVLKKAQGKIDAEIKINSKYFKPYYNGEPTKAYLKALKQIIKAEGITMRGIVNGEYG